LACMILVISSAIWSSWLRSVNDMEQRWRWQVWVWRANDIACMRLWLWKWGVMSSNKEEVMVVVAGVVVAAPVGGGCSCSSAWPA
jgi:hypothetical protein